MKLFCIFLLLCTSSAASLNLSPPPNLDDIEIVQLCGSVPARRLVEGLVYRNKIDPLNVCSLYKDTISDPRLLSEHKMIVVGEKDGLILYINKRTKEITSIMIVED